jgi:hypothetical protein
MPVPKYGLNPIDMSRVGANAQLEFAAREQPALKKNEGSRADVIERARALVAAGNIEADRAALSKLVESGNASAAVDLGSTYDPNILDALGVKSIPADVATARVWYLRAQEMGATEAAELLEDLESSERRAR